MAVDLSMFQNQAQVQLPDPVALAMRGMSLAQLSNQNAMSQYAQKEAALTLQGQQEYADLIRRGALSASPQDLATMGQNSPYGLPKVLADIKAQQLTQAQIEEAKGKANASNAEAKSKMVTMLGNAASALANQPDPIAPKQAEQLAIFAKGIGTPDELLQSMPSVMDQAGLKQWVSGLGAAATDPEKAAQIWKIHTETPVNVDKMRAETGLANASTAHTNVETTLAPQLAGYKGIEANAAATNAQTGRLNFQFPAPVSDAVNGGLVQVSRVPGQGGVNTTAAPVTDQSGAPIQTALNPGQKGQAVARDDRLKSAAEGAALSDKINQLAPLIESQLRSGYTGPLAGSDTGKKILAIAGTLGLPGVNLDDLANSRAADAAIMEIVGPLAREMSSRGSNMGIKIVQGAKPNTADPLASSLQMLVALKANAANVNQYNKVLNQYVNSNQSDFGLVGFKPPEPQIPSLSNFSKGKNAPVTIRGDDGYNMLPSGTQFIDPNGELRTKP